VSAAAQVRYDRELMASNEILWPIVERHLEEADFLAESRRDALDQPDYTLAELAEGLDARLSAHLDGLAIAGPAVLPRLCWPALEEEEELEQGLAAAAGLTILDRGTEEDCAHLLEILGESEADDERWIGLVDALTLASREGLDTWMLAQLSRRAAVGETGGPCVAGLLAASVERRTQLGAGLDPFLGSEDPAVLRAAATLARYGSAAQLEHAAGLGRHDSPEVVAAALESAVVRGLQGAWEVVRYWAFEAPECGFRARALTWLALGDEHGDHTRLGGLLADPQTRADGLWALGFCGWATAVDAVLPHLDDPEQGQLAGEVMTAIAGMPTDEDPLWRDPVVDEAAQEEEGLPEFEADTLDEDLREDPREALLHPEPEAAAAWWAQRRSTLDVGARMIAGQAWTEDSLERAMREQPLRRRHTLAVLLAMRSGGARWPSTRGWAAQQLAALGSTTS